MPFHLPTYIVVHLYGVQTKCTIINYYYKIIVPYNNHNNNISNYVIRNRAICIIILFYHSITIKPRSTYTYSPSAYSKYCLSVYRVFSPHSMFIELIGI